MCRLSSRFECVMLFVPGQLALSAVQCGIDKIKVPGDAAPAKSSVASVAALFLLLQCLHFGTLHEAWRDQKSLDIVAVGVQLLRDRVGLMVDLLRAGLVKAEVRQGGYCTHAHAHAMRMPCAAHMLITERHDYFCQAFHIEAEAWRQHVAVSCDLFGAEVSDSCQLLFCLPSACRCTLVPCS